jgi:Ser/Thr protein kinase RdoA (MazF antagonist)
MDETLLSLYDLNPHCCEIQGFGSGLINRTWLVIDRQTGNRYIFQRVNSAIFKQPEDIAYNIRSIDQYLKTEYPHYLFEAPLVTSDGRDLLKNDDGYFRLFRFVAHSHSIDVVETPQQAFEAACQFGTLTAHLNGFNASKLRITLPDFHNLLLRFYQFEEAISHGNKDRLEKASQQVMFLLQEKAIAQKAAMLSQLPVRVIHHDTKISNVLFSEANKGLCVIDLDTLMPGCFVSDLGDMMRTYLSPCSEEESDFSKIEVRTDFFEAIVSGYFEAMGQILSSQEMAYVIYSGQFMIYMQALRFITDYLNDDIYYGADYEDHNLIRGGNQIALLKQYNADQSVFKFILSAL